MFAETQENGNTQQSLMQRLASIDFLVAFFFLNLASQNRLRGRSTNTAGRMFAFAQS